MNNVDLSIIVPGYRHWEWQKLLASTVASVGDYSFEMIIVGPEDESGIVDERVTFIKDYGAPGRCFQIAASHAIGKFMTWACDDGVFLPGVLSRMVDRMTEADDPKLALGLNYFEGGQPRVLDFFRARHHADQHMPGIKEEYWTSPMFACTTSYFKDMGGIDCRFEHVNFNMCDFMFRVYNDGGTVEIFMEPVLDIHWDVHAPDYVPVRQAYLETDLPLYQELYSQDQSSRTKISFNNWKDSPEKWVRRFADA